MRLTEQQRKSIVACLGGQRGRFQDLFALVQSLMDLAAAEEQLFGPETSFEYEVSWFPPGRPDQTRTYDDEDKARKRYDAANTRGHSPVLSRRAVVVQAGHWETLANAADQHYERSTT